MFAAAAVTVFGIGQEQLSSFGQAVYFMLRYVLLKADEGVFKVSSCLRQDNPAGVSARPHKLGSPRLAAMVAP